MMLTNKKSEWENALGATPTGRQVITDINNRQFQDQIRDAVGDLRLRQIKAVQAKKKIRDQVTRLLAGRTQVKALGSSSDFSRSDTAANLMKIDEAIAEKTADYRTMTEVDYQAKSQEYAIAANIPNTQVYSQITNELPAVENVVLMDSDFIATVSALDILDPSVRSYILSTLDFSQIDASLLPPGESFPPALDPQITYKRPPFDTAINDQDEKGEMWKDEAREAVAYSQAVAPHADAVIQTVKEDGSPAFVAASIVETGVAPVQDTGLVAFAKTTTGKVLLAGAGILALGYIMSDD